ncbi:carboxypeptidase-like regulatory domain-containing protein [Panacibacter sp. DH6]|uniref:Carboxypeptidase-like regulatory domain-containing protein n=1 Tax=Panacibacter microcysteis TaxID=2793269 RepID=A0A931E4H0_9BACT|nr:energy transducer TonB [Panacibacter microcysteis]MBG9375110.1 carboxypeptidase-like regulatory domain-containing protein [Panacibacter microcysteis]
MTDPGAHINYSAQDIERYLAGGMSAKEMHDMEKAALQDPFLADAIEGYSDAAMQHSYKHLNEINALLQAPKEAAPVIAMPAKSFNWWRIAAMIVVLAGVGIFSWYLVGLNNAPAGKQQVAAVRQEDSLPVSTPPQTLAKKADTQAGIAMADNTAVGQSASSRMKQPGLATKPVPPAANKAMETTVESADDQPFVAAATMADSVSTFPGVAPGLDIAKNDTKSARVSAPLQGRGAGLMNSNPALNNFSGYVLDKFNKPVPGAVIDTNNKPVAFTDATGFFQLQSADSVLNVSVNSVGYNQASAALLTKRTNNISIEPGNMSLSEVVVTGYGAGKKAKRTSVKAVADSAYPAGGWQSFQEYVYRRMNKTFDSTNGSFVDMHGMVEIEFSIDEQGDLYNLAITKSLNKEADEKILQALKEGPRWISSKKNGQKKNKVVIRF